MGDFGSHCLDCIFDLFESSFGGINTAGMPIRECSIGGFDNGGNKGHIVRILIGFCLMGHIEDILFYFCILFYKNRISGVIGKNNRVFIREPYIPVI